MGSLKNERVVTVHKVLESIGFDPFSDWYSAGPEADDYLRDYYKARGFNYRETLKSYSAQTIFNYDKTHLDRCDMSIMVMPAGKSAHMEMCYHIGKGKPSFILFDKEPERVDIMHNFATEVFLSIDEMVAYFEKVI